MHISINQDWRFFDLNHPCDRTDLLRIEGELRRKLRARVRSALTVGVERRTSVDAAHVKCMAQDDADITQELEAAIEKAVEMRIVTGNWPEI